MATICVADRNAFLWNVGAGNIRPSTPPLSHCGIVAENAIEQISSHYENVCADKYCIMPDHVRMSVIIIFNENGQIISAPTLSLITGLMKR